MDIAGSLVWAGPLMTKIMYWAGYIVFGIVFVAVGAGIIYLKQFKYKIRYWEAIGSINKDSDLTIDKPRYNRARWNRSKNAWQLLFPLFKNKTISPFDNENIYSGNNVYAFKIGESFVPAKIFADMKSNNISIEPIPHHIRNWQELELKQNEVEFAKQGFWEQNKFFFMVIITCAMCCGLVGLTVYYSYTFSTGGQSSAASLTEAIKGITGGVAPA
jgi:hypothetical protein